MSITNRLRNLFNPGSAPSPADEAFEDALDAFDAGKEKLAAAVDLCDAESQAEAENLVRIQAELQRAADRADARIAGLGRNRNAAVQLLGSVEQIQEEVGL